MQAEPAPPWAPNSSTVSDVTLAGTVNVCEEPVKANVHVTVVVPLQVPSAATTGSALPHASDPATNAPNATTRTTCPSARRPRLTSPPVNIGRGRCQPATPRGCGSCGIGRDQLGDQLLE